MRRILPTVLLLTCSNFFMNTAWYGHLKYKSAPIALAIFASWGIALAEYCFQVPANRLGEGVLSLTQLKITQEILSIGTFVVFAAVVFKQKPTANQWIAFGLILVSAWFATRDR